jgi:predicted transcriptional regulator
MPKKSTLGRAEAEVLRYVADHPGCTVSEVGEFLAETKGQTRNTALNTMERLRAKGFLERQKDGGSFRYSPVTARGSMLESLVDDFVQTMLGGSVSPLVAYLTRKGTVDAKRAEELRKLVEDLEEPKDDR